MAVQDVVQWAGGGLGTLGGVVTTYIYRRIAGTLRSVKRAQANSEAALSTAKEALSQILGAREELHEMVEALRHDFEREIPRVVRRLLREAKNKPSSNPESTPTPAARAPTDSQAEINTLELRVEEKLGAMRLIVAALERKSSDLAHDLASVEGELKRQSGARHTLADNVQHHIDRTTEWQTHVMTEIGKLGGTLDALTRLISNG